MLYNKKYPIKISKLLTPSLISLLCYGFIVLGILEIKQYALSDHTFLIFKATIIY